VTTVLNRRQILKGVTVGGATAAATAGPAEAAGIMRAEKTLPPQAVGMLIDSTLCVGCQACVSACRDANGRAVEDTPAARVQWNKDNTWHAVDDLGGRSRNVIQVWTDGAAAVKDQLKDGFAFAKRHCLHCVDPSCVSVCPVSAMQKDPITGIVSYDPAACIGCRYCTYACPFGVPQFDLVGAFGKINKCEMCRHLQAKGQTPACCDVCPTGATLFGPVADLQKEAERRLEAKPGETMSFPRGDIRQDRPRHEGVVPTYQKAVYGEKEVGGTQVRYLSAVPFEKLGLPKLNSFAPARLSEGVQHTLYKWMAAPAMAFAAVAFFVRRHKNRQAEVQASEHKEH
jgi:Fe-S-cluster-containing dehydrogenase component